MSYSHDLRERVLQCIKQGGKKIEAARRYGIHINTVYAWLAQPDDHQAKKPGSKDSRKFKQADLAQAIKEQPDLMLKELAQRFGVSVSDISATLRKMGISRKKNAAVRASIHQQKQP
jgi:transposase